MIELYIIHVLHALWVSLLIITVGCVIYSGIMFGIGIDECGYHRDSYDKCIKTAKRFLITACISLLFVLFLPPKRTLYQIFAIGTTLDYIQNSDTAKQIPDKALEAIDVWLEQLNNRK